VLRQEVTLTDVHPDLVMLARTKHFASRMSRAWDYDRKREYIAMHNMKALPVLVP
jgi:hypothetical protein